MRYIIFGMLFSINCLAATDEASFTPTNVLVPIREISLGEGIILYSCDGTGDECLVDIADDAALAELTATSSVDVGEYSVITVGNCKNEGEYTAKVKGQVSLGGTTYYTTSTAQVLSTSVGDLDYTSVVYSGCSSEYTIPGGLVVTEGASVTLNLFATLNNIAWGNKSTATIPSGCKSSGTASVCMAYPDLIPSVGDVSPVLESYYIAKTGLAEAESGGQLLLVFDAADNLLGGFGRRLFGETSQELDASFDTPLKVATKNSDGTLLLADYGGSADSSSMTFVDFERISHTGKSFSCPTDCGVAGPLVPYEAFKQ